MNRRKDQPKTSACAMIAVLLTVAIGASGGVLYAYYKNRQIQITREIDEISRSMVHACGRFRSRWLKKSK